MKRAVIYVPGLGDQRSGSQKLAVSLWRLYGVQSEVIVIDWSDTTESFEQKLNRLLSRIDELNADGYQVSLVGASAGATAVLNAFALRPKAVHRIVCICGALKSLQTGGAAYNSGGVFSASQTLLTANFKKLAAGERVKILSIHPRADSVVAPKDTVVPGALAYRIPTSGHAVSIGAAITIFSWIVMRFIKR